MTDPYEHLDEDIEREVAEIIANPSVITFLTGGRWLYGGQGLSGGRGKTRDNAYYGHLSPGQVRAIRKAVREHGEAEIGRQVRKYGVKKIYILRALGRQTDAV